VGALVRLLIAVTGLSLAAVHLAVPDLKIDLNFFALIAVALFAIFTRGLGKKALGKSSNQKETSRYDGLNVFDAYSSRIMKLTPVETLVPYIIIVSMIGSRLPSLSGLQAVMWLAFAVFLILTLIYYALRIGRPVPWVQVFLMGTSFAAWAFALGGPFISLTWYDPVYGALALTITTFLIPAFYVGSEGPRA
jgi:hypothetical protein